MHKKAPTRRKKASEFRSRFSKLIADNAPKSGDVGWCLDQREAICQALEDALCGVQELRYRSELSLFLKEELEMICVEAAQICSDQRQCSKQAGLFDRN